MMQLKRPRPLTIILSSIMGIVIGVSGYMQHGILFDVAGVAVGVAMVAAGRIWAWSHKDEQDPTDGDA